MKNHILFLIISLFSNSSIGEVCDYRPSRIIGTAVVGEIAGFAAATGVGMKAAGLYAITNSVTGATMLGSTAAGASAAGTTGIIAGTSGVIGSVGAALMSPFAIIPSAVIATYEGGCYLLD